jgi:hypothetical protein
MSDKTAVPDKPETSDKSKLDKLLEGGNITLNCLIPGEEARPYEKSQCLFYTYFVLKILSLYLFHTYFILIFKIIPKL